jgi:hypothetical protein
MFLEEFHPREIRPGILAQCVCMRALNELPCAPKVGSQSPICCYRFFGFPFGCFFAVAFMAAFFTVGLIAAFFSAFFPAGFATGFVAPLVFFTSVLVLLTSDPVFPLLF